MTEKEIRRQFLQNCQNASKPVFSVWAKYVKITEKRSWECYKGEYMLDAYHSWGTDHCYWDDIDTYSELKQRLKELGAVNIHFKIKKWNRCVVTFSLAKKMLKEAEEV